jgi:Tol biopolymer transport system component
MVNMKLRPIRPEELQLIKTISDVQLSPDGEHVAYTQAEVDLDVDDYRIKTWTASTRDGQSRELAYGQKHDIAPRWSPDSDRLAFLSDRDGGQFQLYIVDIGNGNEARKLTSLRYGAGPAVWSPDAKRIVFAAQAPKGTPVTGSTSNDGGNHQPRVIKRAHYKSDGERHTLDSCSHLFVVSAERGETRQITSGDSEDRSPTWSLDGRYIAFSRTRDSSTDNDL